MEVGDEELRRRERNAGHGQGRPDLSRFLEAAISPDQPEGDDEGEERQLPADHGAELANVEPGDAGQGDDGRAQRPEGHRRGVGDEREPGGGERGEPEPYEDGRGHGHRRPEAGRALEEGPEGEGDQQQLQPAIFGDPGDRVLQDPEAAVLLGQLVEEDDVEDDPADRR